jgi:hypothetical protein
MRRLGLILLLLVVGMLWGGFLIGDDKKSEKEPSSKRMQLPSYYKSLGLTTKQRSELLEIHRKYATEIQELQQKINDLKDRERVEFAKVLTAKQKARLKELLLGSDEKATGDDNETAPKDKNKAKAAPSGSKK